MQKTTLNYIKKANNKLLGYHQNVIRPVSNHQHTPHLDAYPRSFGTFILI